MSDFLKPQPQRQRTQLQNIQRAIAAGARDAPVSVPGGGGGGGGPNTLDVIGVGDGADGQTNEVLQVNSTNDNVEVGTGS